MNELLLVFLEFDLLEELKNSFDRVGKRRILVILSTGLITSYLMRAKWYKKLTPRQIKIIGWINITIFVVILLIIFSMVLNTRVK